MTIQTVTDNIKKQKQQRKPLLAIYIDLSKAYDTVDHKKLLHKLRHDFNFTQDATDFIASYLYNRQQSTHTTRKVAHPNDHTRNSTRQHSVDDILPTLCERYHQYRPTLESVHVR